MKLPIYDCIINEDINDDTGIFAMSFVSYPANETDFVALNKEDVYLSKDSKKQILTGAVLRPEQLIYRNNSTFGEHYIKFSEEQIEKISHKMIIKEIALFNTIHEHQSSLQGNYLTEIWIVENPDNDKSAALGFSNLPKGTLMCSYKIEDKEYWDTQVMTGNVKGFSLEGIFKQEPCKLNKINTRMKKKKFKFSTIQKAIMLASGISKTMLEDIEAIESNDTTDSGNAYVEFVLKDGQTIKVDDTGYATLDGEQMPAGEHPLANGNILVIDEEGQFVETKESSATKTNPDEATAPETLKRNQSLERERVKYMTSKQKLANENVDVASLQSKISELEGVISGLTATIEELTSKANEAEAKVEEAQTEIAEMKKKTPTSNPVVQSDKEIERDMTKLSHTERMAIALSQSMLRKNNK